MPFAPAAAPLIAGSLTLGSTAAAVSAGSAALAIAPSIFTIGNILTGVSTVVGFLGDLSAGRAAASQAELQASIFVQQAESARQRAALRERLFRRDLARMSGRQRVLLAKAGVRLGEGTPVELQADTAAEGEFEALLIRAGGDIEGARLRQRALIERGRAAGERRTGVFAAGETLLTGASVLAARLGE